MARVDMIQSAADAQRRAASGVMGVGVGGSEARMRRLCGGMQAG